MTELKGYIFEIQKMSTEDGPGIRTTVFFKQCPLRCVWCHNPESLLKKPTIMWYETKCIGCRSCLDVCPEDALCLDQQGMHINRKKCNACGKCVEECPATAMRQLGKWWTLNDLMDTILKDRAYYVKSNGGVTASGGEAAMQTEFVREFLKRCKQNGIHTALDICGVLPRSRYEQLLPYVDLYLYDIKEIDPDRHKNFTGMSNEHLLDNLKWLVKAGPKANPKAKIWIRTPIIPGYTDTRENIEAIGDFIVNDLNNEIQRWDLLAFNNLAQDKYIRMDLDWELEGQPLMTKKEMENIHDIAAATGVNNVRWSGLTRNNEEETNKEKKQELPDICSN